ncbi:MAG: hypothetical protein PHS30_09135 [Bacteroidales bacterium]|nr:hypothetical protein [Bacteroidales bacterium]
MKPFKGNLVVYYHNLDNSVNRTDLCSRRHAFSELYDGAIAISKVRGWFLKTVIAEGCLDLMREAEPSVIYTKREGYGWNSLSYILLFGIILLVFVNLHLLDKLFFLF